ncbi:MAG: carboxypeptidase regulatory-like domain-containing protein [Bacteroidetes bacterium]|nr:carboxypeptidase regulatory-like domain-containing protein [Bacteroidota bacterium]
MYKNFILFIFLVFVLVCTNSNQIFAQGVTTASMNGIVQDADGNPLPGANVIAVHEPSGTQYGTSTRTNGLFNLPNLRAGGPYNVTVSFVGFNAEKQENINLSLGSNIRLEFKLKSEAVEIGEVVVSGEQDNVLNSGRTGAATFIDIDEIKNLPTIKRSVRDLTRLDPRSDGNFSFGGKNWLYNNISLDGSYFNNPFGLDDPAPGGQTNSEPVPFDAIEHVQVSVVPFDVREGGFTGAGINTVTKSGTNRFKGSIYSFFRNESFIGNTVSGNDVIANPDLSFNQSGIRVSGPIIPNKLFFFINAEIERRTDPGSNFVADQDGNVTFGESRVSADVMNTIRTRMMEVYGYDTGDYENYIHDTENEKIIVKLNWNINENNNFFFRYNRLDARQDKPPHPFVLSAGGRGPNENSLPFSNAGYKINNELNSYALELNSRGDNFANRFFASYNRFRDSRDPFSAPFPTIEILEEGVTLTTIGHEPFSIHNILDQDVYQVTNNFSYFLGNHVATVGGSFEYFKFFNSFNIFRHGLFFLPGDLDRFFPGGLDFLGAVRFESLEQFFRRTDPTDPGPDGILGNEDDPFYDFNSLVTPSTDPFKGEQIEVAQLSFYAQDEFLISPVFNLTYGLRVDIPIYITEPVDNPFSRGLTLLDENGNPETVDQSKLPGATPLLSPRVGFNWDVTGDRSTQIRGGTGIFTGRLPFVWIGNVISNPGDNPNIFPNVEEQVMTSDDAILQTSFDVNGMVEDFKWPQVWNTNIAIDHKLGGGFLGTLEFIYGKDINSIYVRNADLVAPVRFLPIDGRPYYGGHDADGNSLHELNPDGDAGVYVIDNSSEGYNYSITAQIRKRFGIGLTSSLAYTFLEAKSLLKSTEIASVLFTENPVKGDPNNPQLSYSEFGNRHRITGVAIYTQVWSENLATHFGLFLEVGEGNRFAGAGGNRYSFIYAGDVNGDGSSVNDLIYIPRNQSEIKFSENDVNGDFFATEDAQWAAFNSFIEQDDYLKEHRGEIADRFGAINPWFFNIDLRVMQDFSLLSGNTRHTFQISLDILNVPNLLNSDWGVRQVANSLATSPLELIGFSEGDPTFNYKSNLTETFVDDPGLFSRWQIQLGLRYFFE